MDEWSSLAALELRGSHGEFRIGSAYPNGKLMASDYQSKCEAQKHENRRARCYGRYNSALEVPLVRYLVSETGIIRQCVRSRFSKAEMASP